MKITGEKGLGRILKVFLQSCFYGGIALLIIWPIQLKIFGLRPNAITWVIYPNQNRYNSKHVILYHMFFIMNII